MRSMQTISSGVLSSGACSNREWDRYAKAEYIRLSMEEGEENQTVEMWDDVPGMATEAPS